MTHPNVYTWNDKFKSEFVYPSTGCQLEKGFDVHIFQNTLTFKGYVRFEDGNTQELLFNMGTSELYKFEIGRLT
jgi:hypothetical protein